LNIARGKITFSTRKAEMPFGPGPPVLAMTRYRSACPPPLINAFEPCFHTPTSLLDWFYWITLRGLQFLESGRKTGSLTVKT
jgi:hypothetical protein